MIGWLAALVLAPLFVVGLGAAWAGRLVLAVLHGRWIRVVALGALVALVYLATVGASAADAAVALVIGALLALADPLAHGFSAVRRLPRRVVQAPRLVGAVFLEMVRGTVLMTKVVVGVRSWRRAGLVDVPLDERTEAGATLSGLIVTVAPGTLLVDIDWRSERMIVHTMDASDPDGVRASIQRMYHRYQKPVLP